jgi:tetratricopeptide (TPR) repeat protein
LILQRISPLSQLALSIALLFAACHPSAPASRKVLFVGLDGADWQLLDPYMAAGAMPNLAALVREGRTAALTTIHPPLSPLVWTTMMTGVGPLEHGILDFTQYDPATRALEPITRDERRVPAIWSIASARDRSVAVFGLWATWPAEPVEGLLVSDRFLSFTSREPTLAPHLVHPPESEGWALRLRGYTDGEVGAPALREYLPWLSDEAATATRGDPEPYAHPPSALRKILVETRTYHRLASEWIHDHRPDLAVVYFQGTDTLGHVFAPYAPPRQPQVTEEEFAKYSQVPKKYFQEIDRMLGDYRKLAREEGAVLVVASDHGFFWGEGRPAQLSSAAAATAGRWHRDEGIWLVAGPGNEAGKERGRGSVNQVCGSLLALLGLPAGKGMAAPPLPGVPPIAGTPVDYGAMVGLGREGGRAPAVAAGNDEAVQKLKSLGYLGGKEARAAPGAGSSTRTAGSYNNEGLIRREKGDARGAAAAYGMALAVDPANVSAMWNLSDLLYSKGAEGRELDRADDLLISALTGGLPDGIERAAARAVDYGKKEQTGRAIALLDRGLRAAPDAPALLLLRGRYSLSTQKCREAAADFSTALRQQPENAVAHASLGLARLCLGDAAGARRELERSLALDPNQPQVRQALARL